MNHWTVKRLREILEQIKQDFADDVVVQYELEHINLRRTGFTRRTEEGYSGGALPHVDTRAMEKVMLDVAILDDALFDALQESYTAAAEMQHLRDSLVNFIETEDEHMKVHFGAFPQYALRELRNVMVAFEKLYRECTGKELTEARLR